MIPHSNHFIIPNWPSPAMVCGCTTTRFYHDHFDQASMKQMTLTEQLAHDLLLPGPIKMLKQVHGTHAVEISSLLNHEPIIADASFTQQVNQVCMVRTADCLPILICHEQGTHVAAIHAGWRGLSSGIIETALRALDLMAHELLVWLGPAIGPSQFYVGTDVYDTFIRKYPYSSCAFIETHSKKWLANLYQIATLILEKQGVTKIYGGNFCTYSQEKLFFSYRRDPNHAGRMATLIWIKKSTF